MKKNTIFFILFFLILAIGVYLCQKFYPQQAEQAEPIVSEDAYAGWQNYTDPENIYSIKAPSDWKINNQWERGNDLPDNNISYTSISRQQGYMILNISKMYSHTPEYECGPKSDGWQALPQLSIGNYGTYHSYAIENYDMDYKKTTSYNYCLDVDGKRFHFEFIPQASENNTEGIDIFYQMLETIIFN